MSGLTAFLSQNVQPDENIKFVASKRFIGEDGKPAEWELRSITSEEDEKLRRLCVVNTPVPGKRNQYAKETDYNKYQGKLAAACTVHPNLNSAELQDSYGVMGADAVLKAMLKPGEYADYLAKVQEINGFDISMDELVEDAKN